MLLCQAAVHDRCMNLEEVVGEELISCMKHLVLDRGVTWTDTDETASFQCFQFHTEIGEGNTNLRAVVGRRYILEHEPRAFVIGACFHGEFVVDFAQIARSTLHAPF